MHTGVRSIKISLIAVYANRVYNYPRHGLDSSLKLDRSVGDSDFRDYKSFFVVAIVISVSELHNGC